MIARPCVAIALILVHSLVVGVDAHASNCTWDATKRPFGIPHAGATDVAPATSIIIVSYLRPEWVQLTAAGVLVPTDGVEQLGRFAEPIAWVWRVLPAQSLQPATEYVVTSLHEGTRIELTRFVTAAAHVHPEVDWKVPLDVQFWRVHFLKKTAAGREYESFIQIGHSAATISTTPPESTLYSMRVFPVDEHNGGETVWYTGTALFKGKAPSPPDYTAGCWSPSFDPSRVYCIDPHVQGYGDLAPPQGQTASVGKCIAVTEIVVGGAGDAGPSRSDGAFLPEPSGCSVSSTVRSPANALPVVLLLSLLFTTKRRARRSGRPTMRWC